MTAVSAEVDIRAVTPQEAEAFRILNRLTKESKANWVLIGGQMTRLHLVENGVGHLARPTVDADVLVDIGDNANGTRAVAAFLVESCGLTMSASPTTGVGHRYERIVQDAKVIFDVLAPRYPDGDVTTTPPARTVRVPGGTQAILRKELVAVRYEDIRNSTSEEVARVWRPNRFAALLAKLATWDIPDRGDRSPDLRDVLALLACLSMEDIHEDEALTQRTRKLVRRLEDDRWPADAHPVWLGFTPAEIHTSKDNRSELLERLA